MFLKKGFNSRRFCRQGHLDPISGGFGVALDIWGDNKDVWVALINNYSGFYSYHTENVDFYFSYTTKPFYRPKLTLRRLKDILNN